MQGDQIGWSVADNAFWQEIDNKSPNTYYGIRLLVPQSYRQHEYDMRGISKFLLFSLN